MHPGRAAAFHHGLNPAARAWPQAQVPHKGQSRGASHLRGHVLAITQKTDVPLMVRIDDFRGQRRAEVQPLAAVRNSDGLSP